ncbi:hypothetical protein P348_02454 [Enterobacter sp. DC3]|nr:hypothetical protein P348_02454 [Enterobacter sp. DC3]
MYSAIGVEPTKLTACTRGSVRSTSTDSLSPCTTLNTPSGRPASFSSCASASASEGSFSDGFSTKVFPVASAIGNIHIGTIAGKLNGVIPAQTPSGCISEWLSTPVPTFAECSPFCRCGIPQANSTTSRPRVSSPTASEKTLPCSSLMRRARRSMFSSSSALKRNITRARLSGA